MRLALLIVLLLAPMAAHAEPVTTAIAIFAAWAVATAGIVVIAATVLSAGMAIYGAAQARRAERDAKNAANAAMQDRMATKIASEAPHVYILGRAKVGGAIVGMFTSGDKDQYKHIVCVLAAHECDAVEEVYINNVAVGLLNSSGDATTGRFAPIPGTEVIQEQRTGPTFTLSKYPVGVVQAFALQGLHYVEVAVTAQSGRNITIARSGSVIVNYQYNVGRRFGETVDETVLVANSPYVRVQIHLGGPTDPADAYLMSVAPGKWTSTSVLRGLCYLVVTLDLNNPEFQGGQVPIQALVRGRKLYDPRTGLTAWSQNPALAIYDYLTSPLCGVAAADLPVAQYITAANVCAETSVTGGLYTINGTVTSDQSQSTVLESMAQCMAGGIVSTTWDIYAGKYIAPVIALDQSDIVGALSITPGASDAAIYNGVKGQFISPANSYVMTDFAPFQNPTYLAADGRDLYTDIPFPFTDSLQRVHNLARIFTEDMRNGFTMKAEFSLRAWPIKVGQRVTFTSAFLGQSAKVYRVTDKSYAPNSAVELTLKEDAASIWDFADAVTVDSTPNTNLPDPWAIAPLASLSCTSGVATLLTQADGSIVPRILVTWPVATTQSVFTNGQIEIEWRAISTETWQKTIVSGSATETYLSPITPGFFYVIRARTVNPSLNVKSNWVIATYQVQVFSARPIVYKWADAKPASPTGAASYAWSTQTYGAAPSGWSLTIPTKPTTGADVTLWVASPLVEDISPSGSTAFDWSTATVSAVGYAAAAAVAAAAAAQTAADAANTALTAIFADNVLSRDEKTDLVQRWAVIVAEKTPLDTQADALVVSRTAYDAAYTALSAYLTALSPAWNDTSQNTTIVRADANTAWANYYTAKINLLNAIAAKTATLSTWAGTTGDGRPTQGLNLLQNGGFESGSNDWILKHSGNAGAAANAVAVTDAFSGSSILELTGANAACAVSRAVAVVPGQAYRVRFKYRALTAAVESYWYYGWSASKPPDGYNGFPADSGGGWNGLPNATPGAMIAVSATWSTYDQLLTIPAGIYWLSLGLHRWSASGVGARLQVDDVFITDFTGDLNATNGAPSGTNVGSTDAALIESRANAAVPTPTGFTLNGTFSGTVTNASTGVLTLTKALSATASGAVGTVSLSWSIAVSDGFPSNFSLSSTTSATPTLTCRSSNQSISIGVTCTATDQSTGLSRVASGTVTFNMGAI